MNIKKKLILWGAIGCLAIGCGGCYKEVCYTTAAPTEATTAAVNQETEKLQESKENAAVETNTQEVEIHSEGTLIDHVVANAILQENSKWFVGDECQAEGHIILEEVKEDGFSTVYALMMYGEYAFENVDYFIKSAGTGVIPVVMKFDLRLSSSTPLVSIEWPEDGSGYNVSIKRMFPEHLWNRTLTIQEEDREILTEMERGYAERYLEALGRDAVIGDYADVERTFLTDHGISVDVSNKMNGYLKTMGPYPGWHGSTEKIEDEVRYLYSVFVDEEVGQIIYEKCVFDTLETVEKYIYDAETGDEIEICAYPTAD